LHERFVGILAEGIGFGNVGEFHPHGSVGIAFQGDWVSQHVSPLLQAKVFLDFALQPFADFLFPMHRQDGGPPAKPNFEVAALGG
jgi:hypothetical protein